MKNPLYILGLSGLLLAACGPLWADESDSGEISRLLRQGDILPLTTILEMVRPVTGTHILEVEAEHEDFGLAYEIYFLDPQGRRRELSVDARTGDIIEQKRDD